MLTMLASLLVTLIISACILVFLGLLLLARMARIKANVKTLNQCVSAVNKLSAKHFIMVIDTDKNNAYYHGLRITSHASIDRLIVETAAYVINDMTADPTNGVGEEDDTAYEVIKDMEAAVANHDHLQFLSGMRGYTSVREGYSWNCFHPQYQDGPGMFDAAIRDPVNNNN